MVLVEGSSESISSTDLETSGLGWLNAWVGECSEWSGLAESPGRAMPVAELFGLVRGIERVAVIPNAVPAWWLVVPRASSVQSNGCRAVYSWLAHRQVLEQTGERR